MQHKIKFKYNIMIKYNIEIYKLFRWVTIQIQSSFNNKNLERLIISIGMGGNLWIQYKKCNNSYYSGYMVSLDETANIINCTQYNCTLYTL